MSKIPLIPGEPRARPTTLRNNRVLLKSLKEKDSPEQREKINLSINKINKLIGGEKFEICKQHQNEPLGDCDLCTYVLERDDQLLIAEQMEMRFGRRFYNNKQRDFMADTVKNREPLPQSAFSLTDTYDKA